jgi:hypothetical protein
MVKVLYALYRCYRALNDLRETAADVHTLHLIESAMVDVQTVGEVVIDLLIPSPEGKQHE